MNRALLFPFLLACANLPHDTATPDGAVVDAALNAVRPGPLLELPDTLQALLLPHDGRCPHIEVLEIDLLGQPQREIWTGGCTTASGLRIEGALEILNRPGEQWLAGDAFDVRQGSQRQLYIDGAVEAVEQADLLFVDAAATWCDSPSACADGLLTVDLSYSIFPADGYPDAYDVTVSGMVSPGTAISVEGAWSINLTACAAEPTDGIFALRRDERHDLTLDGALDCDACASWTVQGLPAPLYCGLEL